MKINVFVFGANRQGRHGKGAALEARQRHGAIYGQSEGFQGRSYAIVTKELRQNMPAVTLEEINDGVGRFFEFAAKHPDWVFSVTPIGCGLAGFNPQQIGPLFVGAPENVKLPAEFLKQL